MQGPFVVAPPARVFEYRGWKVEFRKSSIMASPDMDAFQKQHDMPDLPEMIHGQAYVRFTHVSSGVFVEFNPLDQLRQWRQECFTREGPRVIHSKAWQEERGEQLADIPQQRYDWTFMSSYSGTLKKKKNETDDVEDVALVDSCHGGIPYERLKVAEELLFFDHMILMQDELADCGDVQESVRVRCMPSGWFMLHRMFCRVDHMHVAMHDTRIYCSYGDNNNDVVWHEYQVKQATWEQLAKEKKLPSDPAQLSDENYMYEILPRQSIVTKEIPLK